jgi:hypothetical protein
LLDVVFTSFTDFPTDVAENGVVQRIVFILISPLIVLCKLDARNKKLLYFSMTLLGAMHSLFMAGLLMLPLAD